MSKCLAMKIILAMRSHDEIVVRNTGSARVGQSQPMPQGVDSAELTLIKQAKSTQLVTGLLLRGSSKFGKAVILIEKPKQVSLTYDSALPRHQ